MRRAWFLAALTAALLGLPACGAKGIGPAASLGALDARVVARFGFGAEGGAQPALLARAAGGFALAYVGTRPGDRHLHVATSADGRAWGEALALPAGEFSDASPALVEDAAGGLHLYFVSNRSGLTQQVFHCAQAAGGFGEAVVVPGLGGAQELAATRVGDEVVLVAEVMGAGVLAHQGPPGGALRPLPAVAQAGAEPAVCAMAGGKVVVAFQREGKIWTRQGLPGSLGPEVVAASAGSRLRDPALGWVAGQGQLAWAERADGGMGLRLRPFDATLSFGEVEAPGLGAGESRGPSWAASREGVRLLAWGMKTMNGQQGVVVLVL
ncbi:MAG: hypothetical protein VKS61_11700 [Candidatus Sericytochromatia bacterium]|nr:hypothetical protein [Candidatus Sericytochromatia bacterium]